MDADCPDWPAWDIVRKKAGKDFHKAVTVFFFLNARMTAEYREGSEKVFVVQVRSLRRAASVSKPKLLEYLKALGEAFQFTFKEEEDGSVLRIAYPNFLRKQKAPKRNPNGQFAPGKASDCE
jgi:hypothetical protein